MTYFSQKDHNTIYRLFVRRIAVLWFFAEMLILLG